jgi:transcriptional regulator with XRE-family HTH domain
MNRKALGVLIAQNREKCKLTQVDLAKKLGWSTAQFVSNIERGTGKLPISKIKPMADALKLNVKTFFQLVQKVEAAEAAAKFAERVGL